jgi:hypothetical protein
MGKKSWEILELSYREVDVIWNDDNVYRIQDYGKIILIASYKSNFYEGKIDWRPISAKDLPWKLINFLKG